MDILRFLRASKADRDWWLTEQCRQALADRDLSHLDEIFRHLAGHPFRSQVFRCVVRELSQQIDDLESADQFCRWLAGYLADVPELVFRDLLMSERAMHVRLGDRAGYLRCLRQLDRSW